MGTARATFIIDPDGTVARVPKVSPTTHDDEGLRALDAMAAGAAQ